MSQPQALGWAALPCGAGEVEEYERDCLAWPTADCKVCTLCYTVVGVGLRQLRLFQNVEQRPSARNEISHTMLSGQVASDHSPDMVDRPRVQA